MVRLTNDANWAPVIGRYMIAFGSIESSVNELLRNVIPEGAMKVVIGLPLGQRIKLLRESLADWKELSDVNRTVIALNLDEVVSLSSTRNLIAHNPLLLALYADDEESPDIAREHIKSEQTGKGITLPELEVVTARVEALSAALWRNWIDYDFSYMNGEPLKLKRP